MEKLLIGITGASGSVYAIFLLKELKKLGVTSDLIVTRAGSLVLREELGISVNELKDLCNRIFDENEIGEEPASGSSEYDAMVIIPCSMATLSAIASGASRNLLQRAADVMLKERRRLVLVVREAPLNLIHIKNMETCTLAGAVIFPASPFFYGKPKTLEDLVSQFVKKLLNFLGLKCKDFKPWNGVSF